MDSDLEPNLLAAPAHVGASAAAGDALPPAVWLRGDEPYFADFSLDADTVMAILGIKRSRLRQISGSELRVGRKRVERYLKPFYRPLDVERYLAWTRATASHQKSSLVLDNAAKKLSEESQGVTATLASLATALTRELAAAQTTQRDHHAALSQHQRQVAAATARRSAELASQHAAAQRQLRAELAQLQQQWQTATGRWQDLADQLAITQDLVLTLSQQCQSLQQQQQELLRTTQATATAWADWQAAQQQPPVAPRCYQPQRRPYHQPAVAPPPRRRPRWRQPRA